MAIKRTLIWVAGPRGSGKTALLEQLLTRSSAPITVARCVRDDSLRRVAEERRKGDEELRRFLGAGAADAVHYRFPGRRADFETLFEARFMERYSVAVIFEGDRPAEHADLTVYVALPAAEGRRLLVRVEHDRARQDRERMEAMERLLKTPGGIAEYSRSTLGEIAARFLEKDRELLDGMRRKMLGELKEAKKAPPRAPVERWAIHNDFAGIERAEVVVINVRSADERSLGETMLEEIARIRKDESAARDVLGPTGRRTPI